MGTHNRLLAIGSPAFPRAYLEIIAIDPGATPPQRPRWFGLDSTALREAVRVQPRLLHAVARTLRIDEIRAALAELGQDIGPVLAVQLIVFARHANGTFDHLPDVIDRQLVDFLGRGPTHGRDLNVRSD
jgi:hypothetical protein